MICSQNQTCFFLSLIVFITQGCPQRMSLKKRPESEFNEFEPSLKSALKPFSIERRLKSGNIEHNKCIQSYFSRVSNLTRGSKS